ncbi:MAG: glucokinase [Candidatus Polarisedimenticolia bacterium]
MPRHLLAGDVGGTKVILGLFDGARLLERVKIPSAHADRLEPMCEAFLASHPGVKVMAACFGIAGPVAHGRVHATNLPWVVEESSLSALLRCPVRLVNDLEATAHGVEALQKDDLLTLNEGERLEHSPRALLAAGTGLGEAYMVHDGTRWIPNASEGGHTDFGPSTDVEVSLLIHLRGLYGRASVERVISGLGIRDIFAWLASSGRFDVPDSLTDEMSRGDAAAVISTAALAGGPPICVETMNLFVCAYGSEAGNLALKVMALGGVYIGGGIAPRIVPLIAAGGFLHRFFAKGRFQPLMRRMPVHLILNQDTALLGAARVAATLRP